MGYEIVRKIDQAPAEACNLGDAKREYMAWTPPAALSLTSRLAGDRMDDHELLDDFVSQGSQGSFDTLVQRYSSLVFGVCSRLLPDAAAAEDAVQATFIVLMRKAGEVAPTLQGRTLAGWLHVTAHHAALQMLRSLRRRRRHEQAAASSQQTVVQGEVDSLELRSWLDGALALLSESQREAILLRYAQGMSQEEAAGVMGCSRETVHTHVTRALSKLRELMRRQGLAGSASVIPIVLGEGIKSPVPAGLVSGVHSACFHPHVGSPAWTAASQVMSGAKGFGSAAIAVTVSAVVAVAALLYPVFKPHHEAAPAPAPALVAPAHHALAPLLEYRGHQGGVSGLVFAGDGASIASSSWDSSLQVWKTADGAPLANQTAHTSGVHALAAAPGRNLLVSAGSDGLAILWTREPLHPLVTLNGHAVDGRLLSAAISPDGATIAIGALNGTIRLWSASGVQLAMMHRENGGIWGLAFSPDGRVLASAADDHLASLWDATSGAHLGDCVGHTDCLRSVTFSQDGTLLATSGNDSTVRIWKVADRTLQRTILTPSWTQTVAFSPDGALVATAADTGAQLWDLSTGDLRCTLRGGASLCATFSPDGQVLAVGGSDGVARLWRVSDLLQLPSDASQQ